MVGGGRKESWSGVRIDGSPIPDGSAPSVALFLPDFAGGGAERMTLNLARALSRRGHPVTLVVVRAEGALRHAVPEGVEVVDLGAAGTLGSLVALTRFLQARRPAVLISAHGHNNIVALWARARARATARVETRVVIQQHNVMSQQVRSEGGWRFRMLPPLYRLFGGWADAIVAVSQGAAADLAAVTGVPRGSIRVIPNPVIDADAAPVAETPDHPFFAPGAPPVFLTAGRMAPVKDFETALEAFALVNARRPCRLVMAGEGPLRAALEARGAPARRVGGRGVSRIRA